MNSKLVLVLTIYVAGCATQAQMDSMPIQRVTRLDQNYQQTFANLNRGARTCYQVGKTFTVDGQLFSELGYGEVWVAGNNGLRPIPLIQAKVSRDGSGSKVEAKTSSWAGKEGFMNWVDHWAKGGINCPIMSVSETPPPVN